MEPGLQPRVSNRRSRRLGWALATALALAFAFLLAFPVVGVTRAVVGMAPQEIELQELFVREVVEAEELGSELVVLQAVGESVLVPLFVPPADGRAIRAARAGEDRGAPVAVEQTVAGFGGEILAVILEPAGGSLGGVLLVDQEGRQVPIEISPGAAIATALSTGQPILTTPEALEVTGLAPEDLRRLAEGDGAEAPPGEGPTFQL